MVEIHKKYAIPWRVLSSSDRGGRSGSWPRRGGFGTAATLSLRFLRHVLRLPDRGEKLADRGFLSPFTGMWSANIIIGLMGAYLTVRVARETVVIHW